MIKLIKFIFFIFISLNLLIFQTVQSSEKIKIGLLVPMTGTNKEIGESIIKAVSLAVKDIDSNLIEIYPKDTATKANQTLKSAFELSEMGIKIIIGPVFYESLTYLDEMEDLTFLSLTNKTLDLPKNVISAGINSTSQFNTIKKFLEINEIKRTIFLTPIQDYEFEVKANKKEWEGTFPEDRTGTIIIIKYLKEDMGGTNLQKIHRKISSLVNPFQASNDFNVEMRGLVGTKIKWASFNQAVKVAEQAHYQFKFELDESSRFITYDFKINHPWNPQCGEVLQRRILHIKKDKTH